MHAICIYTADSYEELWESFYLVILFRSYSISRHWLFRFPPHLLPHAVYSTRGFTYYWGARNHFRLSIISEYYTALGKLSHYFYWWRDATIHAFVCLQFWMPSLYRVPRPKACFIADYLWDRLCYMLWRFDIIIGTYQEILIGSSHFSTAQSVAA